MIIDIIFALFILVCVYTDIKFRKVFNFVIVSGVILGFAFNYFFFGFAGVKDSFLGLVVGFLLLFLFYLLGGIGAGDVKFLAAAGSIKGMYFVLIGGIYGAVIGGVAAIIVMIFKKNLFTKLKDIATALFCFFTFRTAESLKFKGEKSDFLPYTVFLSAGLLIRWLEIYFNK